MYICVCNALTDRDVKAAISKGARKVSSVYRSSGCQAQCGKCSCNIKAMIRHHDSLCAGDDGANLAATA